MQNEGTNHPRRRRVKNHPGVYWGLNARGQKVYEIGYTDSSGTRRWKTIGPHLKAAVAAREDYRARIRRGERISPSRMNVAEAAATWLPTQSQLRPRTIEKYEVAFRKHVVPALGRVRLAEVNEEDILHLIATMRSKGLAPWTIRGVLTPFGRLLRWAVRRGLMPSDPMARLERGERPSVGTREQRILTKEEMPALLNAATPRYRAFLSTAMFTGLRLSELLGLQWADVDFKGQFIRVRKQLDRQGGRVAPKTNRAVREVVLMPALGRLLREHRLGSPFSQESDFVFASNRGTPLYYRNAERRGLGAAADAAGLNPVHLPRLRLHDLRHCFASILIADGADVVTVSRQLGHSSASITLNVYAHLFDQERNADRTRASLEDGFGRILDDAGEA
jgi:integrase